MFFINLIYNKKLLRLSLKTLFFKLGFQFLIFCCLTSYYSIVDIGSEIELI